MTLQPDPNHFSPHHVVKSAPNRALSRTLELGPWPRACALSRDPYRPCCLMQFLFIKYCLHRNDDGGSFQKGFFYEQRQWKSQYLPKKVMGSLMTWKWLPSFKMKRLLSLGGPTKRKWHDWSLGSTSTIKSWLRRLVVPSARKCSRRFFRKSEDGWCDLKWCSEMDRGVIWGPDQGLFVLGGEARLSRVCSRRSVFWP